MAKTIQGTVTSDKTDKTIVITVTSRKTHPIYKKQYSVNTKYMAHDENNEAKIGDMVIIRETRPISRRKRFTLDKVVEKAHIGFVEADAMADVPVEEPKVKPEPAPKKTIKADKPAEETKA
jgi:small subunit ribosomal protein S17